MPLSQKNVFGALSKIHEDKIKRDQDKKSKSEARSEDAPDILVCEALTCSRPSTSGSNLLSSQSNKGATLSSLFPAASQAPPYQGSRTLKAPVKGGSQAQMSLSSKGPIWPGVMRS